MTFKVHKAADAPSILNEIYSNWPKMYWLLVWMECSTDVYWRYALILERQHAEAHWHTNTDIERHDFFFCFSLYLLNTHTHTFMTTNWISSVWRQGLLLWRRQVFRRGDGHRKEGGILSTHSFPFGCPPVARQKRWMEKEGRRWW